MFLVQPFQSQVKSLLFQKISSQGKLCWSNWMQLCCALGWMVGAGISSAISRIQFPMQPCRGSAGLCVHLSYTGRISFLRKPLRPSRRESQKGKDNGKGPANAISGSSDMILQCKIAAKLCLRVQSIQTRGKGGGLVLPVVFSLCNCLTWLSQQDGTELCSLSETLRGSFEEKGGKRWLTRKGQRS